MLSKMSKKIMVCHTTSTYPQNFADFSHSSRSSYLCPHAIAAAIKKTSIEALVSEFYTVETLASAYAKNICLINTDVKTSGLTIEGEGKVVDIFSPASRRPPGRPRKSKILSTGKIRVSTC